jgi:hypothetical protein
MNKELKRQLLVALKSAAKALVLIGGGYLSYKLTGSWVISGAVATALAPIQKIIDPTDNSIGFGLDK